MTTLLGYFVSVNEYRPRLDISSSQESYSIGRAKDAVDFYVDEPFIGIVMAHISPPTALTLSLRWCTCYRRSISTVGCFRTFETEQRVSHNCMNILDLIHMMVWLTGMYSRLTRWILVWTSTTNFTMIWSSGLVTNVTCSVRDLVYRIDSWWISLFSLHFSNIWPDQGMYLQHKLAAPCWFKLPEQCWFPLPPGNNVSGGSWC